MSYPTITSGHAPWITDCNDATSWAEGPGPTLGGTSLTVLYGDYFQIEGTCAGAGNEATYFAYSFVPAEQFSTDDYPNYLIRYKTSAPSDGVGAAVKANFTIGTQYLLGEAFIPEFSANWTLKSGTLDAGKTMSRVDLIANDYPDTVAAGTFQVYFDFILFYKDTFTFPKSNVILFLPKPNIANIPIPGREGEILQNLGSEKARVHLWEEMMRESTWGTPKGQWFYKIAHEMGGDLWQWLTLPSHSCKFKATFDTAPEILFENGKLTFDLWLKEYKLADAAAMETYQERFGHV